MTRTLPRRILLVCLAAVVLAATGLNCPKQQTPQATEVIVDNRDAGFSVMAGTWDTENQPNGNGYYGEDFRYALANQVDVAIARFTPTVTATASYQVYMYWSAHPDRTTAQPVIVHDANGNATYTVNLQENGNEWYLLGTHTFNQGTGGYIEVNTDTAADYCNADAIRIVPVP